MPLVFFGSPQFAVPSLRDLLSSHHKVSAVVTQPDKRRGRGGAIMPSPVKSLALQHGIEILEPVRMKDEGFIDRLRELAPEFIVVVAYGRILSDEILAAPSMAPVNLHASLLPRYRGAAPIAWAILEGETETGVSTMVITKKLDTGDVLLQERYRIADDDTTETLSGKLAELGGPLLIKTLDMMLAGTMRRIPQEGPSNYARPFKKEDGHIDWHASARSLDCFVRAMHPWPGAFTYLNGQRLRIHRVLRVDAELADEPGVVTTIRDYSFTVSTGEGALRVLELQPDGKRRMNVRDWLRGHELKIGQRLT